MSQYIFISSNFELPEINLVPSLTLTPIQAKSKGVKLPNWCSWNDLSPDTEIIYCEYDDNFGNIIINRNDDFKDELMFYTSSKYIYLVSCSYDKKRASQLLNYILNLDLLDNICIYSLWVGDRITITPKSIVIDNLSIEDIIYILDNYNNILEINKKTLDLI